METGQNQYLRIAGFPIRIVSSSPTGKGFDLPGQYAPFIVGKGEPEAPFLFTLTLDPEFEPQRGDEEIGQFGENGTDQKVYRYADGNYLFELSDTARRPACVMQTADHFTRLRLRLFGQRETQVFGFNNAMMIAFAFASAPCGALLMHSSVTLYCGRANMNLGKSGTGKSTHSALWMNNFEGTELLNDDNPVLRIEGNNATVYGSPWSGKTPCYKDKSAPIRALVMLEQQPFNRIDRLQVLPALGAMLSSCSTMIWDRPTYHAILHTISDVIRLVPVYHLACLPNREAAELCRNTLLQHDEYVARR